MEYDNWRLHNGINEECCSHCQSLTSLDALVEEVGSDDLICEDCVSSENLSQCEDCLRVYEQSCDHELCEHCLFKRIDFLED